MDGAVSQKCACLLSQPACSGVGFAMGPCVKSWSVFAVFRAWGSSKHFWCDVARDVWECCCVVGRQAWHEQMPSWDRGENELHWQPGRCLKISGRLLQCWSYCTCFRDKIRAAASPSGTDVLPQLPFTGMLERHFKTCLFFLYWRVGREGGKTKPLPFPSHLICLALKLIAACSFLPLQMAVKARSEPSLDVCLPLPPTLRKQAPCVVYA